MLGIHVSSPRAHCHTADIACLLTPMSWRLRNAPLAVCLLAYIASALRKPAVERMDVLFGQKYRA